jgi:LytR cell envelope-related transcriptional attenuator
MLPMEHAVEHALPSPQSHHPWRTIAVVAAGIATLELVGLVVAGTAIFAKPVAEKAARAAVKRQAAPVHKAPARAFLPRRSVGVTVLNANGIAGAAAAAASQVRARGYRIRVVGNAPSGGDFSQPMVMYRPGFRPEALRLARDVGIRLVWPLDGLRPRALHHAQVAVILGG